MQNHLVASAEPTHPLAEALLDWYDTSARTLPWRVSPAALKSGAVPDPYRVWLSEIMLQQTMVEAVKPFFARFTSLWPTIEALAAAEADDIMKAWAGLGYYSRARNLVACAKVVAELGAFPQTEAELRKLPGLGAYTAASVAAIAFGQPAAVVDGNVERVMARMLALPVPPAKAKNAIREAVAAMVPPVRPGDFAQAMMDLGATVCTPRRPACMFCPWREPCLARQRGEQDLYPVKAPKAEKPTRVGAAFVAVRRDGAILLRKRAGTGLLAGMAEVPNSDWNARQDGDTTERAAPFHARWREVGTAEHGFTHFGLTLKVYRTDGVETAKAPPGSWWSQAAEWEGEALPTVMRKAIRCAIPTAFPPKAKGKP
ncbi:A/G-specific adenine glycosylase [Mesorhizobium sp. RP14(2022)]|uniref:Adenine DNA glycosylase n=1 Tax=Mesorhizobium liriopis TaxID=2953882 RepID=A0ABT1C161_9HYPH|nr:A/G-specific adenine glycosylase [Mesorhizobium liriopis]MCO6048566.1 A/G-specific adenine glycosylase [Mesorhizobium liriopis]